MFQLNLTPFPLLMTERLILNQLELSDDAAIFKLRSDDKVNALIGRKSAKTLKDAQDFIHKIKENSANNDSIYWTIKLKNTNDLIGTICFWNIDFENDIAEIGYELLTEYQRLGFMQEALTAVVDYGFKIGFKTIKAFPNALNVPSIKLLERNNFQLIGELKEHCELIYALTQ
jgi:[ribosomal protein S5]-alanine N-acetyltransferase